MAMSALVLAVGILFTALGVIWFERTGTARTGFEAERQATQR
jgi:hypothetical protein